MDSLIGTFAKSFGIDPSIANLAVNAASKMFVQKSTPKAASGLLHSLPKNITDQFDDNQRSAFTTTQQNFNRYDLLKKLSEITNIKDIDKLDDFADQVLDAVKQNTNINLADGLDENELFEALRDMSRRS
jgi:hypothetical protein